ncbi:hypothetical protein JSE7799_00239 [Jannaschia seosinensis]|uniref:Nicotinamide riboside transporter PnuC n=1 Tax=Jannaschia seosinensis TaxID=313367 RepID=A0A0M7B8G2_9RHOB|nr:hypothetical protein [Jannaschia seosinensis]CUH13195.1 hypothetical protein JSE7799_00239 [Jannaschia seosinensis]
MDIIEIVRWVAAICVIMAALMVAWGQPVRLVAWGFVIFSLASILWIAAAGIGGKWALLIQNVVLLGVNLWGVWRWFRRL